MSAIGDYIHYSKKNYRDYGTFKKGEGSNYSQATEVFKAQKEKMINNIKSTNSQNLEEIEDYLNSLLHHKGKNNKTAENVAYDRFNKLVQEAFSETFHGFKFTEGGYVDFDGSKTINSENIKLNTLKKYVKTLEYINGKISNKKKINKEDKDRLLKTIEIINKTIESEEALGKTGNQLVAGKDIIERINTALKLASLPYGGALGAGFENFLGVASIMADNNAEKLSDNMIKQETEKRVVGSATSKVSLDLSKLDQNLVNLNRIKSSLGKSWKIDKNNEYIITANETQDKVDVIFKWKDEELNVSAKNYKLAKDNYVHILSGSSLLYLIQHENADFVNHWLNTVAIAKESKNSKKHENIDAAHEAMKVTILVKALTGQDLGRNSAADTFILNDRTGRKVYVWSMRQLLDKLVDKLGAVRFSNYPYTLKMSYAGNKKYPDETQAQTRITNLIMSLHQKKISISIPAPINRSFK